MRTRARAEASFAAGRELYLRELRVRRYAPSVQQTARRVLARLFAHLHARRVPHLRAVSEAELAAFARRLRTSRTPQGRPLSASSRSYYLSLVRQLFALLALRGVILRDPAQALPLPRPDKQPRVVLSEGQARRLIQAAEQRSEMGKRDRALLELLYATGLRSAECRRAEVWDLDLAERTLLVRNGKGRKDRVVPLTKRAAASLDVYLREARPALLSDPRAPWLFLTAAGAQWSAALLQAVVRRAGQHAGLPCSVSPHALRHACATHLLRRGADVRHIQALLGHRFIDTTVRYTRVGSRDLREAIDRAHPRAKLRHRRC